MSSSRWTLSAESITAAAAVFAALVALSVGVWENVQARRHQRLSVLPYLDFVAEVVRNDSVHEGRIRLSNTGIGPARLESFQIQVRSADGSVSLAESWSDAIPRIEALGTDVQMYVETGRGFMIAAGGSQELLRFSAPLADSTRVLDVLERLGALARYESVYGEGFETTFGWTPAGGGAGPGAT